MPPRERIVLRTLRGRRSSPSPRPSPLLAPDERDVDCSLVLGLVARLRARLARPLRVRRLPTWSPEQLLFVPMLAAGAAPLRADPGRPPARCSSRWCPTSSSGSWHRDRADQPVGDCWFSVGPVLVLAALAPGRADARRRPASTRSPSPPRSPATSPGRWSATACSTAPAPRGRSELLRHAARVDAILSPLAFLIAVAAADAPLAPARDRPARLAARDLLARPPRALRRRPRAAARLPRHRDAALRRASSSTTSTPPSTPARSSTSCDAVADELGVDRASRQELEFAAHAPRRRQDLDPKEILNKPAALTEQRVRGDEDPHDRGPVHARPGRRPARPVGEIVRSCHERWDGTGYPDGLAGEEIPLAARIVFACDAYNAMTTDRAYRAALRTDEALEELRANAGTQFDPTVVAALVRGGRARQPAAVARPPTRSARAGPHAHAAPSASALAPARRSPPSSAAPRR